MKRSNKTPETKQNSTKMKATKRMPVKGENCMWVYRTNGSLVFQYGTYQGIQNNMHLIKDSNGRRHWLQDAKSVSLRMIGNNSMQASA